MDAGRKKQWIEFLVLARKDFYNRWVKEDVHRALFASFQEEAQQLLEKYLDEIEASLDKREVEDPITGDSRPPDERFLRSVEEKIKISESGKLSFRQEVVRKAMVAFKAGEKFTLDNHSRLHEAIEQYLFEERRDVLRLVTSRARPDDEAEQKISAVQERLDPRVRLRRAQREGSAQLRHHLAVAGVGAEPRHREDGKQWQGRPVSLIPRVPGASGTTSSRAAPAIGCGTTTRCARPSATSFPSSSPAAICCRARTARSRCPSVSSSTRACGCAMPSNPKASAKAPASRAISSCRPATGHSRKARAATRRAATSSFSSSRSTTSSTGSGKS